MRWVIPTACVTLGGCFVGSEFPPDADARQLREMLAFCGFRHATIEPQDPGSSHLVVNIFENERDRERKQQCLEQQGSRRNLSFAEAGPLPAQGGMR